MATVTRSARISGWIPIVFNNRLGGLVDISRTGAKVYLSWKCEVGQRIPLVLRVPGESRVMPFTLKVVWCRTDEPGNSATLPARLSLMRDMVQQGKQKKGMFFGYLCGAKFESGTALKDIRWVQRYFENEKGTIYHKQVFHDRDRVREEEKWRALSAGGRRVL